MTHLDRHVNDKHVQNWRYYCSVEGCPYSRAGGKSFPRKDNWRRHMANRHDLGHLAGPVPSDLVDPPSLDT